MSTEDSSLSAEETFVGTFLLVCTINAWIWSIIHTTKVYSDLHTKNRLSVSHRRRKPTINYVYKLTSYLTLISIYGYSLAITFSGFGANFSINYTSCFIFGTFTMIGFQIGKCFMFLTYIIRLHECYHESVYGYKKIKLIIISITISILTLILLLTMTISSFWGSRLYIDKDNMYPHSCSVQPWEPLLIPMGAFMFLFDFTMLIGSIVAFIIPINRLFREMKINSATDFLDDKNHRKMLYVGVKYKIIVICASATSIFWYITAILQENAITETIVSIDFTVNIFCLLLMTGYYPDNKYYQNLCCLCIFCCDRKHNSYKSNASNNNNDDNNNNNNKDDNKGDKKDIEFSETNKASSTTGTGTITISSSPQTQTTNMSSIDTADAPKVVAKQNNLL